MAGMGVSIIVILIWLIILGSPLISAIYLAATKKPGY
jgi:hypothetical protein